MNKDIRYYLGEMTNFFDGVSIECSPVFQRTERESFEEYKIFITENIHNWISKDDVVSYEDFVKDKVEDYIMTAMISTQIIDDFINDYEKLGIDKELNLFKNNFGLTKDEWSIVEFNGLVKEEEQVDCDTTLQTYFHGNPEKHRLSLVNKIKNDFGYTGKSAKKVLDIMIKEEQEAYQNYLDGIDIG